MLFFTQVLEEHESTVLAWHEQGVPLAKQHVPTVELADVSNCLAGMSLANTNEVMQLPPGLLDHQQPVHLKHKIISQGMIGYFAALKCT